MTQPQFYVVGGAVRDAILGVKPTDIDYLVVGATPEWMLANGYTQVGADFPVFLKGGEEYALARTERKTGTGYHGFETNSDPSVTLEQDLERRDLTVNSMAVQLDKWDEFLEMCDKHRKNCYFAETVEDYVHNLKDHIFHKVIMMNGGAFKEDPVRVFRAVRMRHTLPEGEGCLFVADEWDYGARTWEAMRDMVASEDFEGLTPERVTQEVLKTASKCQYLDQLAFFLFELEELGAMKSIIGRELNDFPNADVDFKKVWREGGLTDREAVAFMMLCMLDSSPDERRQLFRDHRYSNDAINFGMAVCTLFEAYHVDSHCSTRGLMKPEKYLEIVSSVTRNEVPAAIHFLFELEVVGEYNIEALLRAYDLLVGTGIEILTQEQRETLSGKAIGDAIREERIRLLDHVLQRCQKAQ